MGEDPPAAEAAPAPDSVRDAPAPLAVLPEPGPLFQAVPASAFPHGAHRGVSCAACHGTPPGHVGHATVACADCHGDLGEEGGAPTPAAACTACHHAAEAARPCATCHAAAPEPVLAAATLSVAGRSRTAFLPFDHAVHAATACAACHTPPTVSPARDCASCHAPHHTPVSDCAACHAPPAPDAHTRAAHRGCTGVGCHEEVASAPLAPSRAVCLACHVEQRDHEPAGDCAACHRLPAWPGPGAAAGGGP